MNGNGEKKGQLSFYLNHSHKRDNLICDNNRKRDGLVLDIKLEDRQFGS